MPPFVVVVVVDVPGCVVVDVPDLPDDPEPPENPPPLPESLVQVLTNWATSPPAGF